MTVFVFASCSPHHTTSSVVTISIYFSCQDLCCHCEFVEGSHCSDGWLCGRHSLPGDMSSALKTVTWANRTLPFFPVSIHRAFLRCPIATSLGLSWPSINHFSLYVLVCGHSLNRNIVFAHSIYFWFALVHIDIRRITRWVALAWRHCPSLLVPLLWVWLLWKVAQSAVCLSFHFAFH